MEYEYRGERIDTGEWVTGYIFVLGARTFILTEWTSMGFIHYEVRPESVVSLNSDMKLNEKPNQLTGWEPLSKICSSEFEFTRGDTRVPADDGLVEVLYADGTIREMRADHVCHWVYPYIETGYVVAWRPMN